MYALIVESLGFLAVVALMSATLLGVSLVVPGQRFPARLVTAAPQGALRIAWITALVATMGSLYFSEVVGFEPCELCWFQRIAMYPLVVVLGVALLRRDLGVWKTAVPLSGIGALISAYHVMVQWRPALEITECSGDVPCSARYVMVWGVVSIPVMAGAAFLLITAILVARVPREADEAVVPE